MNTVYGVMPYRRLNNISEGSVKNDTMCSYVAVDSSTFNDFLKTPIIFNNFVAMQIGIPRVVLLLCHGAHNRAESSIIQ